MKTLQEITKELANAGLTLTPRSVRRKLNSVGVYAASHGLRPARWPADAAQAVLVLSGLAGHTRSALTPMRSLRSTRKAHR